MYVDLPPTHCSKCDSTNSEGFSDFRTRVLGIRCKNCGHEKITSITTVSTSADDGWFVDMQKAETKRTF